MSTHTLCEHSTPSPSLPPHPPPVPTTVMPVKRSGITAMLMASWLVRKHPERRLRPTHAPNWLAPYSCSKAPRLQGRRASFATTRHLLSKEEGRCMSSDADAHCATVSSDPPLLVLTGSSKLPLIYEREHPLSFTLLFGEIPSLQMIKRKYSTSTVL